jgi:mono/diheme cytochrome c family protein
VKHFPNETDMINFIKAGSEMGKRYGTQGQGSGRMPGFGSVLTDEQIKAVVEYVRSL